MTELILNSVFAHSIKKNGLNAVKCLLCLTDFFMLQEQSDKCLLSLFSGVSFSRSRALTLFWSVSLTSQWFLIFLNGLVHTYSMDIRATESQPFVWASSPGTGGCSIACHHSSSAFLWQEERHELKHGYKGRCCRVWLQYADKRW